jgi:hypothetical protein
METTEKLTVIDGTEYIWHKEGWKEYAKYQNKHRRKKFVRLVKRGVAGPVFGFLLTFATHRFFAFPLAGSLAAGLAVTAIGLYVRFRYVKYVYVVLVGLLYLFLILRTVLAAAT